MAEHGYWHDSVGYWQAIEDPSPEILATYPVGYQEVPFIPGEYFKWNGSEWYPYTPDPEVVAESLSDLNRFEFKRRFRAGGITKQMIVQAINAIDDDDFQEEMRDFWEDSYFFPRLSPFVLMLAAYFHKSIAQINAIWKPVP